MPTSKINPVFREQIEQDFVVPLANSIKSPLQQENVDRLRLYHQVGSEIVSAKLDIEEKYGRIYTKKLLDRLAELTGISHRLLYLADQFARTYSAKDLKRICAAKAITWSHIRHLLGADADQRRQLEEQIISEKLSVDALKQILPESRAEEKPKRATVSKSPRIPSSPAKAVSALLAKSQQYREQTTLGLFREEFNLVQELECIPYDRIDEKLCQEVAEATAQLAVVSEESASCANELRAVLELLRTRMNLQAEHNSRVAAGEDPNTVARNMALGST